MVFNQKNLAFVFVTFLLSSSTWADDKYWQEFEKVKQDPDYALIFDRTILQGAREVAKAIHNEKKAGASAAAFNAYRWFTLRNGVIVLDANAMPRLHEYVQTLCRERDIAVFTILVIPEEGYIDVWGGAGFILLGYDVLRECTDEEIEAVIAREIAHIEYDHSPKIGALNWAYLGLMYYLYHRNILTGMQALLIPSFVWPSHLIGAKFEWEADNFACEKLKKTKGLLRFFQRLQYKEDKAKAQFDMVDAIINENEENGLDGSLAMMSSQSERFYYKASKLYRWFYETPYGLRPSPADRIANAKRIAEQQENEGS